MSCVGWVSLTSVIIGGEQEGGWMGEGRGGKERRGGKGPTERSSWMRREERLSSSE